MKISALDEYHNAWSNKPLGETYRRYNKYWNYLLNSPLLGYEDELTTDDIEETDWNTNEFHLNLEEKGIQVQKRITKATLHDFFEGKIRDFDYLLKLLEKFKNAKYQYPVQNPFNYELIAEDTVVIQIAQVPEEMTAHIEDLGLIATTNF